MEKKTSAVIIVVFLVGAILGYGGGAASNPHLANYENQISGLENQLDQKDSQLLEKDTQLLEKANEIAALNATIQTLQAQLAQQQDLKVLDISFSRQEDTAALLANWIGKANSTIQLMVMLITYNDLATALINAHTRGVNVTIIIDDTWKNQTGSDYQQILDAGVDIRGDNSWRLMHHKVLVIDDYIIVTGSYNWSASAEDKNFENIIIISSQNIADTYQEEFNRIWQNTIQGQ